MKACNTTSTSNVFTCLVDFSTPPLIMKVLVSYGLFLYKFIRSAERHTPKCSEEAEWL